MRIAVMGAGGVGGYFGGMLAKAGNPVAFIARGEHLRAIRDSGLRVSHSGGDFTVAAEATDDPGDVGRVDLVLFTVKAYDTDSAISAMKPLLAGDTAVLTLQNGVDSHRTLDEALGQGRALPGAAYVESRIDSPGVVVQTGEVARIVFGEATGAQSQRAGEIGDALRQAGIDGELSSDVVKTLWTKFLFIAAVAGVTSACRAGLGSLLKDPEHRGLLVAAMKEIEAVGRARGVLLDDDVVAQTMGYVDGAARDIKASMHTDLERGRRLELDVFNGAVARLGAEAGVDTPVNRFLYLALKPHVNGGGAPPG